MTWKPKGKPLPVDENAPLTKLDVADDLPESDFEAFFTALDQLIAESHKGK